MAVKTTTLLAATTSSANSSSFGVVNKNQSVTIVVDGLAGSEKAYLDIFDPVADDFTELYVDGFRPYCDATANYINLDTPGIYRIAKDSTVGAVGVAMTKIDLQ